MQRLILFLIINLAISACTDDNAPVDVSDIIARATASKIIADADAQMKVATQIAARKTALAPTNTPRPTNTPVPTTTPTQTPTPDALATEQAAAQTRANIASLNATASAQDQNALDEAQARLNARVKARVDEGAMAAWENVKIAITSLFIAASFVALFIFMYLVFMWGQARYRVARFVTQDGRTFFVVGTSTHGWKAIESSPRPFALSEPPADEGETEDTEVDERGGVWQLTDRGRMLIDEVQAPASPLALSTSDTQAVEIVDTSDAQALVARLLKDSADVMGDRSKQIASSVNPKMKIHGWHSEGWQTAKALIADYVVSTSQGTFLKKGTLRDIRIAHARGKLVLSPSPLEVGDAQVKTKSQAQAQQARQAHKSRKPTAQAMSGGLT